ncbi:hypothetical protein SeMB42_g00347 [Synchytrium endobioticum]|nr:hypothetical protein SeMB42_g00347 [Synchytrium endobioticum]
MPLRGVTIPARSTHTATLFFLHGLGDSGSGWAQTGRMMQPALPHVKMVFPDAPSRPVTLNLGMTMPAWFDIYELGAAAGNNSRTDDQGMNETLRSIAGWIKDEIASGIPAHRIVLGGFSQGSAMSLLHAVTTDQKLAGFIALSGWLPQATALQSSSEVNKDTPIFLGHGDQDEVVPWKFGEQTYKAFKDAGWKVEMKTYEGMGHSAGADEFEDILAFLLKTIPPASS